MQVSIRWTVADRGAVTEGDVVSGAWCAASACARAGAARARVCDAVPPAEAAPRTGVGRLIATAVFDVARIVTGSGRTRQDYSSLSGNGVAADPSLKEEPMRTRLSLSILLVAAVTSTRATGPTIAIDVASPAGNV